MNIFYVFHLNQYKIFNTTCTKIILSKSLKHSTQTHSHTILFSEHHSPYIPVHGCHNFKYQMLIKLLPIALYDTVSLNYTNVL